MTDTVGFTVTRGNPTDEELAAVVAVLTALAAAHEQSVRPVPRQAPRAWSPHWIPYRAPGAWTPFTHLPVGV